MLNSLWQWIRSLFVGKSSQQQTGSNQNQVGATASWFGSNTITNTVAQEINRETLTLNDKHYYLLNVMKKSYTESGYGRVLQVSSFTDQTLILGAKSVNADVREFGQAFMELVEHGYFRVDGKDAYYITAKGLSS